MPSMTGAIQPRKAPFYNRLINPAGTLGTLSFFTDNPDGKKSVGNFLAPQQLSKWNFLLRAISVSLHINPTNDPDYRDVFEDYINHSLWELFLADKSQGRNPLDSAGCGGNATGWFAIDHAAAGNVVRSHASNGMASVANIWRFQGEDIVQSDMQVNSQIRGNPLFATSSPCIVEMALHGTLMAKV